MERQDVAEEIKYIDMTTDLWSIRFQPWNLWLLLQNQFCTHFWVEYFYVGESQLFTSRIWGPVELTPKIDVRNGRLSTRNFVHPAALWPPTNQPGTPLFCTGPACLFCCLGTKHFRQKTQPLTVTHVAGGYRTFRKGLETIASGFMHIVIRFANTPYGQ
jgi:hypothetical protein